MAALILFMGLLLHSLAFAAEIEWMVQDLPPIYIRSGPNKGTGYADRQMELIIGRLPEFQHKVVDTSFARAWHDIGDHDNICISGVAKTAERTAVALFSQPIATASSSRLLIRVEDEARFKDVFSADGKIDLDRLSQRKDLTGGYAARRSFSNRLDAFVHRDSQAVKLEVLPNEFQLFNLLKTGRIDFMFASLREIEHYQRQESGPHLFKYYAVAGEAERVDVYVACSDQPVGRAVIARVDWLLGHSDLAAAIRELNPK